MVNRDTCKGKTDWSVKASADDDGECIVTKSNACATEVCGRLGTGQALPVYIVFACGQSLHPSWAPHIDS